MRIRDRWTLRGTLAALLASTAIMLAAPDRANAQASPALSAKGDKVETLLAKAAEPGGVRVIVTLAGDAASHKTAGAGLSSSDIQATLGPAAGGPLGDGQLANAIQTTMLSRHLGADRAKTERWSPRLIVNTPLMAMNVTAEELNALANDPDVVSIHEDGQGTTTLQDSIPLIGTPAIHVAGATGGGSMVAVLDTGVRYDHVFTNRVTNATCFSTSNASFATNCPNGLTSQFGGAAGQNCNVAVSGGCFHGTHVAGIAAGNRASGTPLNGVAKAANIFAGQVFSRRLSDNAQIYFDSNVLASLNDLLARVSPGGELAASRVAAVNMSLGDGGDLHTGACDAVARGVPFKTVIDALRAQNVATVIAAGNDGQTNRTSMPGCISTAITVASSTKADGISGFTNMSTIVDVIAPGSDITSSTPNTTTSFGVASGTSMAAPHVAGAFAAIRTRLPSATVTQIETALEVTGLPIADVSWTKPRIRLDLALANLLGHSVGNNDNFANARVLSGNSGVSVSDNFGATKEASEGSHYGTTSGNKSLWWRWTAPATGQAVFDTIGSSHDTILAVYRATGPAISSRTQIITDDDTGGTTRAKVWFHAISGQTYHIATDTFSSSTTGGEVRVGWSFTSTQGPTGLLSAILPYARSVTIGTAATAFGTIINNTGSAATNCYVHSAPGIPASTWQYRPTDANNNPIGSLNEPINIAAGAAQGFVFGITPQATFNGVDIPVVFDCDGKTAAPSQSGLNTFLLSASSTPTPDMVSIAATLPSNGGYMNIPGNTGTGFFTTAAINIGAAGTITATADTNGVPLPLTLSLCQTNASGVCINPAAPGASSTVAVGVNGTVTFAIFGTGSGNIPANPAVNRAFLRLKTSDGVTRGATSAAVRTVAPPPAPGPQASLR